MPGQTLTSYDAMLKEFYGPGMTEDLNQEVPFLRLIEKDATLIKFDGRRLIVPIHTGRNSGYGSRAENAVMPSAGSQEFVDYIMRPSYQYGAMKLTGQVIEQSRTDKGAFGRSMQIEMENLKKDVRLGLNFQFLRDGNSVRAAINAPVTSANVTFGAVTKDILPRGMVVDIYSFDFGTKKYSGLTVQSVTMDPKTWNVTGATLSSSVTVVSGDVIVNTATYGNDLIGLDAVVGAGTYGSINPATYEVWQSPVLDNSGTPRPINYSIFQDAADVADIAGGGQTKYWWTTYKVRKNFFLYMSTEKRIVNEKKYDGGFTSVEYDGKEIFVDRMCKTGVAYGIDPAYLYRVETREMHWIDDDGTILHRSFDDTDTYFAKLRYYCQLACTKRDAQVKITDIQE
jgi:hypothetical protein